jgi:hypothetical protein
MTVTNKKLIKGLEDTKSIISKGWCRGDYKKGDRHCTLGAMARAANLKLIANDDVGDLDWDIEGSIHYGLTGMPKRVVDGHELFNAMNGALAETAGVYSFDVHEWNDHQTDKRKIIRTIDRTIENVRSGTLQLV